VVWKCYSFWSAVKFFFKIWPDFSYSNVLCMRDHSAYLGKLPEQSFYRTDAITEPAGVHTMVLLLVVMLMVRNVCCSFQWRCRATNRSPRAVSELWVTPVRHHRRPARRHHHHHRQWRHTVDTKSSASVPFRLTSASVFHSQLRRPSQPTSVWPYYIIIIVC